MVRVQQKARGRTTGSAENTRPSLRNDFNGVFRALPGDHRLVATVVRERFRGLSACFGAPGPHDFAVRVSLARLATLPASTASRPAFVTTRTPLLPGRDGANTTTDLGFWKSEIFLQKGLDSEFEKRPVEAGQEFAHLLA